MSFLIMLFFNLQDLLNILHNLDQIPIVWYKINCWDKQLNKFLKFVRYFTKHDSIVMEAAQLPK